MKRTIKRSNSDSKPRTEKFDSSTSVSGRKSSETSTYKYAAALELAKGKFPDSYHQIPIELLEPKRSTRKPKRKPRIVVKAASIVVASPEPEKQEETSLPLTSSVQDQINDPNEDDAFISLPILEDPTPIEKVLSTTSISNHEYVENWPKTFCFELKHQEDWPKTVQFEVKYEEDWPKTLSFDEECDKDSLADPININDRSIVLITENFSTDDDHSHKESTVPVTSENDEETDTDDEDIKYEDPFSKLIKYERNGAWNNYDNIGPHDILEGKKVTTVEKMFPAPYFEKLGPVERRLQVAGQKFKVSENESFQGSLYRAVAKAATGSESHFQMTKQDILAEILKDWLHYYPEIVDSCGFNVQLQLPSIQKKGSQVENYKDRFMRMKNGSPVLELRAASKRYGFNFVLIDANSYDGLAQVYNSDYLDTLSNPLSINYHFMRTGSLPDSWCYEFLIPIGPATPIPNGSYPLLMYDVILVDRQHDTSIIKKRRDDHRLSILKNKSIAGFGLDHRMFFYKPTYTNDLWSLLSELLFKKLSQAPDIYEMSLRTKIEATRYYNYSKLKKKNLKGQGLDKQMVSRFWNSLNISQSRRGNPTDLEHAASVFNFSFTLIGLDNKGNFFWKEIISEPDEPEHETLSMAFFVKLRKNRDPYWYALEDSKWNSPQEVDIYKNRTFTDDTTCSRKLYHPAEPCVTVRNLKSQSGSQWAMILSRVNTGRRWLAKGMSQIRTRTRIDVVAHQVSIVSTGFFSRLIRFFDRLRIGFKVRVHPYSDKSIKQLYLRDHP